MQHIDHHTLELFLLRSDAVKRRRRSVEKHLAGCPHCRRVAGEIEEIYASAGDHLNARRRSSRDAGVAVARRTQSLMRGEPVGVSSSSSSRAVAAASTAAAISTAAAVSTGAASATGTIGRIAAFARRHPVGVVSTSLTAVALSGFAFGLFVRDLPKDTNPARVHYESARGKFAVQNAGGETLWERNVWKLEDWERTESLRKIQFTNVVDLDGDGKNEVVTSLPLMPYDGVSAASILRIFDSNGSARDEKQLGHAVRYLESEYPKDYSGHGGVVVLGEGREILVTVPGFRSPTLIARLDGKGRVRGEYWHYGHLVGIYGVRSGGDRSDRIIVTGINDVEEKKGIRFPVIAILNTREISDTTESSASRGFGYPRSAAEEIYLRIPANDIGIALGKIPAVTRLVSADSSGFRFIVVTALEEQLGAFEYVFSKNLEIREVLPVDGIESVHADLLRKGMITSRLDRSYMDGLKNSVEYWDGHSWHKRYCRVERPVELRVAER